MTNKCSTLPGNFTILSPQAIKDFGSKLLSLGTENETAEPAAEALLPASVEKLNTASTDPWYAYMEKLPTKYKEELLRVQDSRKRLDKLNEYIAMLKTRQTSLDKLIADFLTDYEDYQSQIGYLELTRLKDKARRDQLLLEALKENVAKDSSSEEFYDARCDLAPNDERAADMRVVNQAGAEVHDTGNKSAVGGAKDASVSSVGGAGDARQSAGDAHKVELWVCEFCTYHNPMAETICGMCSKTAVKKTPVIIEDAVGYHPGLYTAGKGGIEAKGNWG